MITALVALSLSLVAGGCRGPQVHPEPLPLSSPTVAPVAGPVPFHVQLGAGQQLKTDWQSPGDCPGLDAWIDLGPDDGLVLLAAYGTGCATGKGNGDLGNGRHGVYRTTDDIPPDRRSGAVTVPTALGEATVFNQPYYECTNFCKNYTEPVAVITLGHPVDPSFKALIVYGAKGEVGLDRLSALLRDQLRP